ncbi:MAG: hypothetical protein AVDCRST_MAG22-2349, partial [uncultured Rubrobacteraceae bacterium]
VAYSHDPGVRNNPDLDPRSPDLRQHRRQREHRYPGHLQPRRATGVPGGPPPKRRPRPPAVPEPEQHHHGRADGCRALLRLVPPARHRQKEL